MSAPIIVRPNMSARVLWAKGNRTNKAYFCLAVDGTEAPGPIILRTPEWIYNEINGPEVFFKDLADRINNGGR